VTFVNDYSITVGLSTAYIFQVMIVTFCNSRPLTGEKLKIKSGEQGVTSYELNETLVI
jgi:hypothetical protein